MPMISEATPIAFADPLPEAADVVVIGAGVVGVSTAYFLARSGARVAVFEKGRVAGEQSSRNWGWVRQQGRDPSELPIVMESKRIWRGLAEETGERDLAFTECGCLYVATDPERMARWEEWLEVAAQHQLDSRIVAPREVEALVPALNGAWAGGIFTPSDGRAEPFVAVPALARAARRLGAAIVEGCAVRTVETEAGRVRAVHTERGRVGAQAVVLAGGAWTSYFASNLGLDLPQLTVRATAGRTNPVAGPEMPAVYSPQLCIRRRADGGYTVANGDLVEHYVGPRSFRYLTKFRSLLAASARDLRLRLGPPRGFPGSWGGKRRWTADEVTPLREDPGAESAAVGDCSPADFRPASRPGPAARGSRHGRVLGRDDRRDPGRGSLYLRSARAAGALRRNRHERTRLRDRPRRGPGPCGSGPGPSPRPRSRTLPVRAVHRRERHCPGAVLIRPRLRARAAGPGTRT